MLGLFTSGDFGQILFAVLVRVFVVICILPIRQYAQAFTAYKLGDPTPKWSGDLTLNPWKHLDPIGALAMVLVGIGWGRPLSINPGNFKNPKKGMAITAFAGPLSNLILALISMLLLRIFSIFGGVMPQQLVYVVSMFFSMVASINISLAIFTLIPCPPLDGYRILSCFLPERITYKIAMYERYIWLGLMAVLIFGVLDYPLSWVNGWVTNGLWWLISLPFNLLGL